MTTPTRANPHRSQGESLQLLRRRVRWERLSQDFTLWYGVCSVSQRYRARLVAGPCTADDGGRCVTPQSAMVCYDDRRPAPIQSPRKGWAVCAELLLVALGWVFLSGLHIVHYAREDDPGRRAHEPGGGHDQQGQLGAMALCGVAHVKGSAYTPSHQGPAALAAAGCLQSRSMRPCAWRLAPPLLCIERAAGLAIHPRKTVIAPFVGESRFDSVARELSAWLAAEAPSLSQGDRAKGQGHGFLPRPRRAGGVVARASRQVDGSGGRDCRSRHGREPRCSFLLDDCALHTSSCCTASPPSTHDSSRMGTCCKIVEVALPGAAMGCIFQHGRHGGQSRRLRGGVCPSRRVPLRMGMPGEGVGC